MLPKIRNKSIKNQCKTVPSKSIENDAQKLENGPPNADPKVGQFWTTGFFYLTQAGLGSQHASQGSPKSPRDRSGPPFSPIFGGFGLHFHRFGRIWTDLVIVVQSIGQSVSQPSRKPLITQSLTQISHYSLQIIHSSARM